MSGSLKIEIVTPEGVVFSEDALLVGLPARDGAIGVLPHHVHLMTQIVPGEITVRTSGGDRYLAVGEGLVEVTADHVTVVTDMAVAVDKIDEAKAEEARERAAARLRDKISDEEVASVNASLARSLAQLRVKRRHRG
jgi:F-type H+-transporting ATPase subunit epsilon